MKNGQQVIFNTDPKTVATVVGVLEDGYAVMLTQDRIQDTAIKKLSFAEFEDAHARGLIEVPGMKPKRKRKAKKKPKAKEGVTPPWGKR